MAFACRMVSASAPTWIGIRDRVMDATTVSIALRVDRAHDLGQMSRHALDWDKIAQEILAELDVTLVSSHQTEQHVKGIYNENDTH